jgi:hypothetical protein
MTTIYYMKIVTRQIKRILMLLLLGMLVTIACGIPVFFDPKAEPALVRESQRTAAADTCDLTHYLGVRIVIDKQESNAEETMCDFTLYFENQHPTKIGVPVVKAWTEDCYAGTSGYEWQVLQVAEPGKDTSWWGYHHLYKDPDCTSGVVSRNVMMAALIEDIDFCRARVTEGGDYYDEGYLDKIATAVVLDCPFE